MWIFVFLTKGDDLMFGYIAVLFIGVLLIAYGIFAIRNPTFGWRLSEGWKVKGDSEPSEGYILSMKFGGLIVIVMGSFFLIVSLLKLLL